MNTRTKYNNFIKHWATLAVTLLIFIALRIPWMGKEEALELWSSMLVQIGIAIFTVYFVEKQGIIRQRTLLPALFYLILVGTNPLFFHDWRGSIYALLILLCLSLLFDTFQNPFSQRNALNISIILTLASLYWTPLLVFFPLFWLGMRWFKSLNLNTFFASLMGWAVVYLFLLAWSVYKGDWTFFLQMLPDLSELWDFRVPPMMGMEEVATNIFLGALFFLSVINNFVVGTIEKAHAKTALAFLSLLAGVIAVFFLGQYQWRSEWLLISYIPLSVLLAHYFTLSYKRSTVALFWATVLFFLLVFAWQWIPW